MSQLVIKNTRRALIELPPIRAKLAKGDEILKDATLDVDGHRANPVVLREPGSVITEGHDSQKLKPGENNVNSDYWDRICSNKAIKIYLACGYLVNLGEGTAQELVADLDKLDSPIALDHINQCATIAVLTSWAEGTENPIYLKAITARKGALVDQATGRPVRGANHQMKEGPTFGDKTTSRDAEGSGAAAYGVGEQGG